MGGEPYDPELISEALAKLPIRMPALPRVGEVASPRLLGPAEERFVKEVLDPHWRRKELFSVMPGTGVMTGFPKRLSVSAGAAIALGLVEDPTVDAMDRERWELLAEVAKAAQPTICGAGALHAAPGDAASRTIQGEVVESGAEVSEIPGPTPEVDHPE